MNIYSGSFFKILKEYLVVRWVSAKKNTKRFQKVLEIRITGVETCFHFHEPENWETKYVLLNRANKQLPNAKP